MQIPIVKIIDSEHIRDYILITKKDLDTSVVNIPDASVFVYHFHPITHEYCGESLAYIFKNKVLCDDINNVTLVSTSNSSPYAFYESESKNKQGIKKSDIHYTQVFNTETQTWEYKEDHRNFRYKYNEETKTIEQLNWDEYNKKQKFYSEQYHYHKYYLPLKGDTPNSSPRIADFLGPLPDDAVIDELPSEEDLKNQILKHVYTAFDSYMFNLFRNLMDISDYEKEEILRPDYTNQIINSYIVYERNNVDSDTRKEIQNSSENTYLSSVRYNHLYSIFISAIQQVMNYDNTETYINKNIASPLGVIAAIHNIDNREKVVNLVTKYANYYHLAHIVLSFLRKKLKIDNCDFSYKELYINKDINFDFEYIVQIYIETKTIKLSK